MPVHLVKLAVGVDDVDHLRAIQSRLIAEDRVGGGPGLLYHRTRNKPRREAEVLDGGSLYRVIRKVIVVRQRILGIEPTMREDGKPACLLVLDPELVPTRPRPMRAFQGWRYLEEADAPPDAGEVPEGGADMPAEMQAELRELGLL